MPAILKLTHRWIYVWRRNADVFLRLWKTNFIPPIIEPFFVIFAFGVGVGQFIGNIKGVPYLVFVSAGLLASQSILRATFECTFGSFFRMKYQNTYEAIISTPVSAYDLAFGEIMWGATRAAINSLVIFIVLAALGVFKVQIAWPALLIVLIGSVNFAATSLIVTSKIPNMEYFNFYFAGFVFPTLFLAGTYFPLEQLPGIVKNAIWILPFTSTVDTTRSVIIQRADSLFWLKMGYIFVSTLTLVSIAMRSLKKRLIV